MKKIILLFITIISICICTYAQVGQNKQSFFTPEKTDIGLGVGTTFYLGDFNEWMPFNNPRYYGSVHHRYSFNLLYSLRTSVSLGKVAGNSRHYKGELPYYDATLPGHVIKFERTFVDINMGVELGFRAFDPNIHRIKQRFAPYLFLGLGMTIMYPDKFRNTAINLNASQQFPEIYGSKEYNEGSTQIFTIPIGIGFKWSPWVRWTVGAEWQFKKSFWDMMDRFDNTKRGSKLINSDWLSTFGVTISYRLKTKRECPAVMPREPLRESKKGVNRYFDSYDSGRKSNKKRK